MRARAIRNTFRRLCRYDYVQFVGVRKWNWFVTLATRFSHLSDWSKKHSLHRPFLIRNSVCFFFVFRINFQIRNLDSYASCWLDSRHFLSCISFEWSALTRCGCWAYFIIPGNGQINANCGCVRRIKVDKISSRWYSLADKNQKNKKSIKMFIFSILFLCSAFSASLSVRSSMMNIQFTPIR